MRRYRTAISCFIVLILVILSSHFAMAQPDLDGRGIDRNQLAPITPQNIARLEALGTFGVGAPLQMAFSATGEAYAALTTAGLWHDATRGVSFGTPPSQTLPRRLEIPVPPSQSPEIDISLTAKALSIRSVKACLAASSLWMRPPTVAARRKWWINAA